MDDKTQNLLQIATFSNAVFKCFNQTILFQVRLPRLLEAMLTGAVLTLAGQVYQIVLNNPLADSFTLGLASGASLGSGIALFLGLSFLWFPIFSIIFSLITDFSVFVVTDTCQLLDMSTF